MAIHCAVIFGERSSCRVRLEYKRGKPKTTILPQSWPHSLTSISKSLFYTRDTAPTNIEHVTTYLIENIRETKRIRRKYGRLESPIYPYIWYRRGDNGRDLDADVGIRCGPCSTRRTGWCYGAAIKRHGTRTRHGG